MSAPVPDPAYLTATDIWREHGARTVLAGISLSIGPEDRVGLVGSNGVGKSTLLRILAGLDEPDRGRGRRRPAAASVGYFAQERDRTPGETTGRYLARRTGVSAAEAALTAAADALAGGSPGADDIYSSALDAWSALGAADLDARVEMALSDLGLGAGILDIPAASLSGGQAARVDLAAILLSRFGLTLLDEPTNDLDFDGLERLESFLLSRPGGVVVVSHDRAFLERVITSVVELDEHTHRSSAYGGGWSAFLEEKATGRRHAEEAHAVFDSQRRELGERAQRERQWATSGVSREKKTPRDNDKAQRDFRLNRTERLAARARRTERAIERLEEVEKPWEAWELRFSIEAAPRSGAMVTSLEAAVIERGAFRLGPIDVDIRWGDRLALVGPNGSGKTTLIEALLGRLPLAAGTRRVGPSVVIGELGQGRTRLSGGTTLLEGFPGGSGATVAEVRNLLAKFGLGADHVGREVATLSPGERTRAELAAFQASGVNLLVLDEPTNHLDMPAIEQLETALTSYSGTLVLVSHDRRLLDTVTLTRTLDLGRPADRERLDP